MAYSEDDIHNILHYEDLLKRHGDSYKALDWGSRESQIRRFQVLAEIGISSGDTVLDVGCGLADFHSWLQLNIPGVIYSGIDISSAMIVQAAKKYPNAPLFVGTIFNEDLICDSYDYIVASGIFTMRQNRPFDYLSTCVAKMFSRSRKGTAFNCLSTWGNTSTPNEFKADPLLVLRECQSLADYATLRHDYHSGDFTIYLKR